jgi:hypothetical protein
VTKNEASNPRVMAGLVPAIPINWLSARLSEIAGTSPAMTGDSLPTSIPDIASLIRTTLATILVQDGGIPGSA